MVVPPSSPFNGIKSESTSDQPTIIHTYCSQELRPLPRDTLENLPNWRTRFPNLAEAHIADQLTCPIIHLSASLNLRHGKSPDGAELWGHFEILIPSPADPRTEWQCKQSVTKPADLYGDASIDPPIAFGDKDYILSPEKEEPGLGTIVRVSFPALPWAHALGKLADLQERFEDALRSGTVAPTTISARQYIDQISMYQEIYSRTSPYAPWSRRAAIAWTFSKAKSGEKGTTSWRYLDAPPARRDIFSPHPGHSHVVQASMNENFNAWAGGVSLPESQGLNIQLNVPADTNFFMPHGGGISASLATSPQTALLSPFESYSYPHHDVPGEQLSFISQQTADHENTLVEATAAHNLNSFLSNEAVGMEAFDQGHNLWPGSSADAFVGTEWAGTYGLPGTEGIWDVGESLKAQGWTDDAGGFR
jgi:transcriptional enhancer factor